MLATGLILATRATVKKSARREYVGSNKDEGFYVRYFVRIEIKNSNVPQTALGFLRLVVAVGLRVFT